MFAGVIIVFLLFISFSLLLLWVSSRRKIFVELLAAIWGTLLVITIVSGINSWLAADEVLEKDDYYGQYIVNRSYFPGKQAD
jgi:hypothetical protein